MRKHKKNGRPLGLWLVYALALTALVSTTTLSRYLAQVTGSGTATIAAVGMETPSLTFGVGDLAPGGSATYSFNVTNFEGTKTSEVTLEYTVTVETTGNLPLTFSLQCTGTGNKGTGIGADPPVTLTPGTASSSIGTLPAGINTTHSYTLTATWPSASDAPKYADEADAIRVKVNAIQAEPNNP
ncbi:MAG: hypothetical protein GX061_03920 [Eubacteriaceae bacterium]|nr:hypothetical protein [Eubacteriaceae bacterium]